MFSLDNITNLLHLQAEVYRMVNPQWADGLHWVAANLHKLNDVPDIIPCKACGGNMRILEKFCPSSVDYQDGLRAIYKCRVCGDVDELRDQARQQIEG